MPQQITDTLSGVTTTGVKTPGQINKAPELGFTAQASLSDAGVSAVVELQACVIPGKWETLGTITLPVPSGESNAAARHDAIAVFSGWRALQWNVVNVSDPTGLTLSIIGLGV